MHAIMAPDRGLNSSPMLYGVGRRRCPLEADRRGLQWADLLAHPCRLDVTQAFCISPDARPHSVILNTFSRPPYIA